MPDLGHESVMVRQSRSGAVLELVIDNPPVNALNHFVRAALAAGIAAAVADPQIAAVVIRAQGRLFSAGGDITEFDRPPRAPLLAEVCRQIEACPKPVVVALHGHALGGGLELALAAHHRLALADAWLGLPEAKLGLVPGAGGTQRLPRLIGAEQALRLLLTGQPVSAAEALALGLLDRVVDSGLAAAAQAMALAAAGCVPVQTGARVEGLRNPVGYQAAIAAARQATAPPGAGQIVARIADCVEAAQILPLDQGLAFERAAFVELAATPAAAGLRHAFLAERRLARQPDAAVQPRALANIAVIGAAGPALALVQAGCAVTLLVPDRATLVAMLEQIAAGLEAVTQAGGLTPAARDAAWARLTPVQDAAALAAADLVLCAGAAAMDLAEAATRPGAVLVHLGAAPAADAPRAADRLGLVLADPASGLAEMIATAASAPDAVATLRVLLASLGGRVLRAQAPGQVVARVAAAGQAAVGHLVAAGHAADAVARALADFGLPQPFWPNGAQPGADAAAESDAIVARVLAAMANSGAALLGQGVAQRPSDIDAALILGLGFPRWQGGPMYWADGLGLLILRHDLRRWAEDAPEIWGVAPLIDELINLGLHFRDLNAG